MYTSSEACKWKSGGLYLTLVLLSPHITDSSFTNSPSGISQEINYDFNDAKDIDFQKIIINPEGSKIMSLRLNGFMCEYDFDRCSGVINNPQVIYPEITTPSLNRLFWEGSYSPENFCVNRGQE
ncbi:MAG: hypothetical protein IPF75_00570 [Bacteroidetes bacterium]|nr:hypothetical protein [Bacteroidota bacterium]